METAFQVLLLLTNDKVLVLVHGHLQFIIGQQLEQTQLEVLQVLTHIQVMVSKPVLVAPFKHMEMEDTVALNILLQELLLHQQHQDQVATL